MAKIPYMRDGEIYITDNDGQELQVTDSQTRTLALAMLKHALDLAAECTRNDPTFVQRFGSGGYKTAAEFEVTTVLSGAQMMVYRVYGVDPRDKSITQLIEAIEALP